jgi:hypothetical protein
VHGLAAQVALVLAVIVAGSATILALTRRAAGSFFLAGVLWTGLVAGVAAVLGVAVAVSDHPPRDPLHIVYGALAVGLVPGAAIVAGGRTAARRTIVWAIAGTVLVILIVRLFQTGG